MRQSIFSTIALFSLITTIGCANAIETPVDINADMSELNSALERDIDVDVVTQGQYDIIVLSADVAVEYYNIMNNAGTFSPQEQNGLSYLYGQFSVCVSNGVNAACHLYSDEAFEQEGFSTTFFGSRTDSLAGEVFGAVSRAQGIDPRRVRNVDLGRFQCGRNNTRAGCGILLAPAVEPEPQPEPQPEPEPETFELEVSFDGLEDLGSDYVYEGWLIVDGEALTAGRFDLDGSGESVVFEFDADTRERASLYVLTIEPRFNDDPAPSATHVVAGAFNGGVADLSYAHPAALGDDFENASGGYILGTPSNTPATDLQGIWFINPRTGRASLDLPTLPDGWVYEGWIVTENGPITTGTFRDPSDRDSDGAGPTAGPNGSPDFPGQDYINPAINLVGLTTVISIEPSPDNSPAPFAFKPLVGANIRGPDHVLRGMDLNLSSFAFGLANWR